MSGHDGHTVDVGPVTVGDPVESRTHLVDEHGVVLCPEAAARDAMDDGEFWDHVAGNDEPVDHYDEDFNIPPEVAAEWEVETRLADPCPECGQVGACAYDADGRALIHVTESDDV